MCDGIEMVGVGIRMVRVEPMARYPYEEHGEAALGLLGAIARGQLIQDLAQRLGSALQRWTGNRWAVSVVATGGEPTIAELRDAEAESARAEVAAHPLMLTVLEHFPKATIADIRTRGDLAAQADAEALPEVEDEWDPFEED